MVVEVGSGPRPLSARRRDKRIRIRALGRQPFRWVAEEVVESLRGSTEKWGFHGSSDPKPLVREHPRLFSQTRVFSKRLTPQCCHLQPPQLLSIIQIPLIHSYLKLKEVVRSVKRNKAKSQRQRRYISFFGVASFIS